MLFFWILIKVGFLEEGLIIINNITEHSNIQI